MTKGRVAALALLAIVAPLSSGAAAARLHVVTIDRMAFGPMPANVRAGDTIMWVNHDMFQHSATARDQSFDVDLAPGKSARTVVRKAGLIPFFCKYHPGMKGAITIAK